MLLYKFFGFFRSLLIINYARRVSFVTRSMLLTCVSKSFQSKTSLVCCPFSDSTFYCNNEIYISTNIQFQWNALMLFVVIVNKDPLSKSPYIHILYYMKVWKNSIYDLHFIVNVNQIRLGKILYVIYVLYVENFNVSMMLMWRQLLVVRPADSLKLFLRH